MNSYLPNTKLILNIDNIEFSITSTYNSVYVKESSGFIMFNKIHLLCYYTFWDSLRMIERNADCDIKVNYEVISYEVQTSDFLHIAVKSIGQP